jgi:CheY-like chemotaxis protein
MADEPQGRASDKTILIVDDDENVRSLLELTIQMEGFNVVTAINGLEALKIMASAKPPDLIITDLMMPGQGGYEFLRNLQAEGGGRLPVYVISASNLDRTTIDMIRQEANVLEFIPKPVPMAALMSNLHKQLNTLPPALQKARDAQGGAQAPW